MRVLCRVLVLVLMCSTWNISCRQKQTVVSTESAIDFVFLPERAGPWKKGDVLASCDFRNATGAEAMDAVWRAGLQDCNLGTGWTHPLPTGILAMGEEPTIDVSSPSESEATLIVTARAFPDANDVREQTMALTVNGVDLGNATLNDDWSTHTFFLDEGVLQDGNNKLDLRFGYRISPREQGKKDVRLFSGYVRDLQLVAGWVPADEDYGDEKDGPMFTTSRRDDGRFEIEVYHPGAIVFSDISGSTVDSIAVECKAVSPQNLGPEVSLEILGSAAVSPDASRQAVSSQESFVLSADFTHPTGFGKSAVLRVSSLSENDSVTLSPSFWSRGSADTRTMGTETADGSTPNPPDVVLIVLDAARYDRFSCHGYEDMTTPNIDGFADGALVFENAFALAPYTLCSVPTMVTGYSPFDHRVYAHGDRLSDRAVTLAEYLSENGHKTACISASPNNSVALGTDQGYDVFVETWKSMDPVESRDPFKLSSLAVDWIRQQNQDQAIHLQLHYVPPHSPYDPDPEFNIFVDREYRGLFDGSNQSISDIDHQRVAFEESDVEYLSDLYDGNLREVDAALQPVFEALESRKRWDRTLVIVTSDHGEAFMEHGRMGHNSTLFDEMLHVPLIVKLPESAETAPATDQLVSLADIVPTVRSLLGHQPSDELAGWSLIGGEPLSAERVLFARTAGDPPVYSARTARWKTILSGSGQGWFFDLEDDPEERCDLSLIRRAEFVALGRLLTRRMAVPSVLSHESSATGPLSEADVEMLEALGYLQ